MAGGLMNVVSQGQQNIILNGNPKKTFWKVAFKRYTNFGLQKFRLDYNGSPILSMDSDSVFTFNVDRKADLLVDAFLSIQLPNIWSPIYPPQQTTLSDGSTYWTDWAPYEFRWIKNVGAQIIRHVEIYVGGQMIQKYSGAYLQSSVQRDFSAEKRQLFNEMIGQIPEVVDPANANGRTNVYPNAYYTDNPAGPEPSISTHTLTIPLNTFFSLKTQQAFPLCALQNNILSIRITLRPVNEWFQIRDITDYENGFPYIQPNFNNSLMQMYRFLQPPPDIAINQASYIDTRVNWNANIHLETTYGFLSNDERTEFARSELIYPIKTVREIIFYDTTGQHRSQLNSTGMVLNWMFYFQRSDVNLRNEWSNYSNWEYQDVLPVNVVSAPDNGNYSVIDPSGNVIDIGPGQNEDGTQTGLYINQDYSPANIKQIMTTLGIVFDGEYRENLQTYNVYNYIEKYTRTSGGGNTDGLLVYNFCLQTSPFQLQPSGAQSMSPYNKIELEYSTIYPPLDVNAQTLTICDPETGQIVGINKPTWNIYQYNYNLIVFEETFNQLIMTNGNAALQYQYS